MDNIDSERRLNEKKKLIDRAAKAKFKIKAEEHLQEDFDPIDIYLDPTLTDQEKQIKKVKKLLNNKKAFHLYKKSGSLYRDKDYLNLPQRLKQRKVVQRLREKVTSRGNKHNSVDLSTTVEGQKSKDTLFSKNPNFHPNNSVHVLDEGETLGLFKNEANTKSNIERKLTVIAKSPKIKHVSKSLYTPPERTFQSRAPVDPVIQHKHALNILKTLKSSTSITKPTSNCSKRQEGFKTYLGDYFDYESKIKPDSSHYGSILEKPPRKYFDKTQTALSFIRQKIRSKHTSHTNRRGLSLHVGSLGEIKKHNNSIKVKQGVRQCTSKSSKVSPHSLREKPTETPNSKVRFLHAKPEVPKMTRTKRKSPNKSGQTSLDRCKQNRRKTKEVIEKCNWARDAQDYNPCKKFDCDIFLEDFKQDEFGTTLNIMQNIEFAEASTLTKLFDHQLKNVVNENQVAYEVNKEYRSGIMDPVRDVAQHEKQAAIKKRIIKKKQYDL